MCWLLFNCNSHINNFYGCYNLNIFYIDENPTIAAQMQCDKHVVKMILESAQMLSTAHRVCDGKVQKSLSPKGRNIKTYTLDGPANDIFYKAAHVNHPSSAWARQTRGNYNWLYLHFVALCNEYTYRYNKFHLTEQKLRYALVCAPKFIQNSSEITPIALAMPDEFKTNDPIESYRNYYMSKQDKFKMVWSNRQIPFWFKYKYE